MADRRVKICFWVEDLDTKQRLSLDGMDAMQIKLVFDTSEIEAKVAEAKEKLPDATEEQIESIVGIMPIGWANEIIRAGYLTVQKAAQNMILHHLGYPTTTELLARHKQ